MPNFTAEAYVDNAIIIFLTLFGDGNWYNAENIILSFNRIRMREEY
jgi:hypothetical protein